MRGVETETEEKKLRLNGGGWQRSKRLGDGFAELGGTFVYQEARRYFSWGS